MAKSTFMRSCLAAVLTGLVLAGCAQPAQNSQGQSPSPGTKETPGSSASTPKAGGTLTVRLSLDMTGIDPHLANSIPDFFVLRHAVDGLMSLDDKLVPQPELADSYTISSDGLVYTFVLRQGVKFHNGKEMQAEDVKASLERLRTVSPRKGDFNAIREIKILDKYKVEIDLSEPNAPFLAALANPYIAAIMSKETLPTSAGGKVDKLVGTGPWMLESWTPGQQAKLVKFKDYQPNPKGTTFLNAKKVAYIDELIFKPMSQDSSAIAALQTKRLDFIYELDPGSIDQLKSTKDVVIREAPGSSTYSLWLDLTNPLLANKKIRQAIDTAINRDEVLQFAAWGKGQAVYSWVPEGVAWYSPVHAQNKFPYDPSKAKQMLKDAGYNGAKMVLQPATSPIMEKIATSVQAQLKAVGMNVEIEKLEFAKFMDLYGKGQYSALVAGHPIRIDPDFLYRSLWHSKYKFAGNGYNNPQFDALVEKAMQTQAMADRVKLYDQAQEIIAEDLPAIPLIMNGLVHAHTSRLQGFQLHGSNFLFFWNTWLD